MDSFEYIDDYFKGIMPEEQKIKFQERLQADKVFEEDVAFYLGLTQVARNQNQLDKKKLFKDLYYEEQSSHSISPVRKLWPAVLAAAAVLTALFVGFYLYMQPEPSKLADGYINSHLQTMSVEMGNAADLMQNGKDLYNNKDYNASLQKFEQVIQNDTANYEAREFAGIVALQKQDYDKALIYFKQVANNSDLRVNPGKFYQALTLMKRDQPGDKEQSRLLLQDVVKNGLAFKEDALGLLKKL